MQEMVSALIGLRAAYNNNNNNNNNKCFLSLNVYVVHDNNM